MTYSAGMLILNFLIFAFVIGLQIDVWRNRNRLDRIINLLEKSIGSSD